MRRCNTREPTLLSAIMEEERGGCDCGDGICRVRAISKRSLRSIVGLAGRQRPAASSACLWRAGRDLEVELIRLAQRSGAVQSRKELGGEGGVDSGRVRVVEHQLTTSLHN